MAVIRVNANTFENGEEFQTRLLTESDTDFKILLNLLSSYWQSTVDGPNYARELKAIAIALARIRLMLSDVQNDTYFVATRTEFLYQNLTSFVFPNLDKTGIPNLGSTDVDFREFLQSIISIYFKGSIPQSMQRAVELITGGTVVVRENFLEARSPSSGFDISDEFGFTVDVLLDNPGSIDIFLADQNIRILLNIIRPAHTLFRMRYILSDTYTGQSNVVDPSRINPGPILDTLYETISDYGYEDIRRNFGGVAGIDNLGTKKRFDVVGEVYNGF